MKETQDDESDDFTPDEEAILVELYRVRLQTEEGLPT